MKNFRLILIVHSIRSCHNVGSLLRTADGLGIEKVYLTGYTPFPKMPNDPRIPHEAIKIDKKIDKTSLGAQHYVSWGHAPTMHPVAEKLKASGFALAALEQTPQSTDIEAFTPPNKLALVVGSEREGIDQTILELCDRVLEISMKGQKESFNVAVAAAIAMYALSFQGKML